jgi:hypothetical protein
MIKQNWTEIKKHLKSCSKEELSGALYEMYKLSKANKEFLHLKLLAGNSREQREALLEKTVSAIRKAWDKVDYDPYGYGRYPKRVKITPIKSPVINYKKALGEDEGYAVVLSEYIVSGITCFKKHWDLPTSAISSIDSILSELFKLISINPKYFNALSIDAIKTIATSMDGGMIIGCEAHIDYTEDLQKLFDKYKDPVIYKLEYQQQDETSKPIYIQTKMDDDQLMMSAFLTDSILGNLGYFNRANKNEPKTFPECWGEVLVRHFGCSHTTKIAGFRIVTLDYYPLIDCGDAGPDMFDIETGLLDKFKCSSRLICETIKNLI